MKHLALAIVVFTLAGCGGGGGGGDGGDGGSGNTFPAGDLYNLADGESLFFVLTGSTINSDGSSSTIITRDYLASRQPNTTIEGSAAKSILVNHGASNQSSGGAIFYTFSKYFYPINGEALISVEYHNGVQCFPGSEYRPVPLEVKIGDVGHLGGLSCSDATFNTTAYIVEESYRNADWAAITTFTTVSPPDGNESYADTTSHIDSSGTVQALDFEFSDSRGNFINLRSVPDLPG